MQYFTFHRSADRLRADVRVWQVAVGAESVACILIVFFMLPPRPRLIALLALLFQFALTLWFYSRPLRRRHSLSATTLTLVHKTDTTLTIPRNLIQSAERFTGALPHGVRPIAVRYVPREDTIYLLPDKKNLVAISLKGPVRGRLPFKQFAEFTRVVCLVDEPEAFIAAVQPDAGFTQADGRESVAEAIVSLAGESRPQVIQIGATDLAKQGPAAIELRSLAKRFGDYTAVDQLSLRVAPGEIFAFLGSNGAGKSTTIKMLVGLLRPTSGTVLIGGQDPWQDRTVRRKVGYVPDSPMLYENLTAQEHLWLIGGLYDLPEAEARARGREVLQQMGLEQSADQPIRTFSLGMKRKLAIASALMHRPPILLLDEATNGLDPRAAREVKDFIGEAARSGTTIFLTTHLLDVVSELADRVAIIDQGVLKACGTHAELQQVFGRPSGSLEEIFLLATDRRRKEAMA